MKIGDIVESKIAYTVIKRHGDIFEIIFANGISWYIPIYIPALGINPPSIDFVYPGQHLDEEHPDFYRRAGFTTAPRVAAYLNKDENLVFLKLDKNFSTNGTYKEILVENNLVAKTRLAQLRTEKERFAIADSFLGTNVSGETLKGEVLYLLHRWKVIDKSGNRSEFIILNEEHSFAPMEVRVGVIAENFVEYELPMLVL